MMMKILGNINRLCEITTNSIDFMSDKEKLNDIHSLAWSIQLDVERLLRKLSEKE